MKELCSLEVISLNNLACAYNKYVLLNQGRANLRLVSIICTWLIKLRGKYSTTSIPQLIPNPCIKLPQTIPTCAQCCPKWGIMTKPTNKSAGPSNCFLKPPKLRRVMLYLFSTSTVPSNFSIWTIWTMPTRWRKRDIFYQPRPIKRWSISLCSWLKNSKIR